jgi:hypothetical protein
MFTEEQQRTLANQHTAAVQIINDLTAKLATASQTIVDQVALIECLSKNNLALVAKLDALTGKKAPGTTFAA